MHAYLSRRDNASFTLNKETPVTDMLHPDSADDRHNVDISAS